MNGITSNWLQEKLCLVYICTCWYVFVPMMGRTTGTACTAGTARATGTASTTGGPPAVTATGPPKTSCSNLHRKALVHEG